MNVIRDVSVCYRRLPAALILMLALLHPLLAPPVFAQQWQVVETDTASDTQTPVAQIRNEGGYTLAIYRDSSDTVRARFTLNDRLYRLHESICPSYQIDERQTRNTSINNQSCHLEPRLSEYNLGTIENNRVISRPLYELMNGSTIDYRFLLQAGGYDQASFSLAGSKRTLTAVLGTDLEVLPR